jgi:mono/diheme cytochrome c family protein
MPALIAACAAAAALVLTLISSCTTMSAYSVTPQEYSGVRLYQVFCSSCHGLTGHGDGPVVPLLKGGVPDLTELSRRNGGMFPAERVRQIIDGRSGVPAHGTQQMPVWGFEFYGNVTDDALARKQAEETIQRLVDYLRTIQPEYDR